MKLQDVVFLNQLKSLLALYRIRHYTKHIWVRSLWLRICPGAPGIEACSKCGQVDQDYNKHCYEAKPAVLAASLKCGIQYIITGQELEDSGNGARTALR